MSEFVGYSGIILPITIFFTGLPVLPTQVFTDPPISEEAMVTVVDDWVNFYISYYRQQVMGEQQEQDRALQELRQELTTLSTHFLDKYRAFLKSL